MAEERKLQIPVEVDATGAKQGFGEVKSAAQDMAQAVQQAGQQASRGVDGIGNGAPVASQKVDAATRSIIGSIQRTTAVMEAGGRTSSKYYEALAAQRGVSVEALKPYLAQLDEVAAKQAKATGAVTVGKAGLDAYGNSAKQTAQALRQVPAQITDIVTSLASGQAPLTVLIQQGGQLKDLFGGVVPAARALGGAVLGMINPLTIAAATIGGIAFAANAGAKELRAFQNEATLTGNAVGLTNSEFARLRESIGAIATEGKAAEALTAIAASGLVAGDNVRGIAEAAILMEKATGQAVSKTVEQFKELSRSPADAAAKLNEQYNFLTAAIYQQINALEEQGRVQEAAALAERTYADALKSRAQTVVDNAGLIERAWRGITGAAKGAWDAMLGIGRGVSNADQIGILQQNLQRRQESNRQLGIGDANGDTRATAEIKLQIDLLRENERMEKRLAESQAARAQITRQSIEWQKQGEQFLTKQAQREKELTKAKTEGQALVNAGIITERELTERLNAIRQKYIENTGQGEAATVAGRLASQKAVNDRLRAQIASGDFTDKPEATQAEKDLLVVQEKLKTSLTDVARAQLVKTEATLQALAAEERQGRTLQETAKGLQEYQKALDNQVATIGRQADAVREQALQQEAANATFGKSKTAIEELALAQLKQTAAQLDATDSADPRYIAGLYAKIEAQERYVEALKNAEAKQLAMANSEWARVVGEEAKTLQLEVGLLGLTQEARERIIGQRRVELELAKRIAEIDKSGASPEEKARLRAEAEGTALAAKSNAAQRALVDEWNRTTQSINNSLTDALLRGFESGKDFAQNLRDTIANMFRTMVLRPVISGVMAPVSGLVSGAVGSVGGGGLLGSIGSSFAGAAATSAFGGVFGSLGALGGGLSAGFGGLTGSLGSLFGAAGTGTTLGGALSAGSIALQSGNILGGLGTFAGALGPLALGAVALGSLFGGKRGGPKVEGFAGTGISTVTNEAGAALAPIVAQYEAQFEAAMRAFGGSASARFGLASVLDPKGDAPSFVGTSATVNGQQIRSNWDFNVGRDEKAVQAAIDAQMKETLVAALRAADLPGALGDLLRRDMGVSADRVMKIVTERQTLEARLAEMTDTALQKLNKQREAERAAIDETNRALLAQVHAQEDLARAGADLVDAFNREQGALKDYAKSLREFVRGLQLSPESPLGAVGRTNQAGQQFSETLAKARAGDTEARSQLTGASSAFLNAALASAGSRAEFNAIFARVTGALTMEAASAESQATVQQQQLDVMRAQLESLGLLNQNVLSFAQALSAFGVAKAALDQAKVNAAAANSSYVPAAPSAAPTPAPAGLVPFSPEWYAAFQAQNSGSSFASGGFHTGGLRLVGEQGPELEVTGPARIYSASQTRDLLKGLGNSAELTEVMREVLAQMKAARSESRTGDAATVTQLTKMSSLMNKWDRQGTPPVREEVVA